MAQPEDQARENIDRMLTKSGWAVHDQNDAHISAYRGLAIRNFTFRDTLFTEIFPGRTTSGALTPSLYDHVGWDKNL